MAAKHKTHWLHARLTANDAERMDRLAERLGRSKSQITADAIKAHAVSLSEYVERRLAQVMDPANVDLHNYGPDTIIIERDANGTESWYGHVDNCSNWCPSPEAPIQLTENEAREVVRRALLHWAMGVDNRDWQPRDSLLKFAGLEEYAFSCPRCKQVWVLPPARFTGENPKLPAEWTEGEIEERLTTIKHECYAGGQNSALENKRMNFTREIYGAIYDWYLERATVEGDTRCDVYVCPDDPYHPVRTVTSGASYGSYIGDTPVMTNVSAADFIYDDPGSYSRDEYVEACVTAHGLIDVK